MRITIDQRFDIDIDTIGNHTLIEHGIYRNGNSKGKPKETVHGYYRDIPSAVQKYLKVVTVEDADRMLLADYVSRYEKAVNKVIRELKQG